ncbi:MAG TPA: head GIN domain-containing protein [Puia sp.]|nr:head GIN domain-containing protein [Puia sp.]
MRKIILIISSLFVLPAVFAQNKIVNDPNAQVRKVGSFHAIRVATGIHLYLTQGNEETVAVSADIKESRDRIVTEVVNGVLKIHFDNHDWFWNDRNNRHLRAYVSCKILDELKASSGAYVDVEGSINSGAIAMDFSSGASFKGNVTVKDLKVKQGSGAHSTISGTATAMIADASSGSHIDAFDLQTSTCDADASSGGHISINVSKELNASASSGGQIYYSGDASIRSINTSSGGHVSKK